MRPGERPCVVPVRGTSVLCLTPCLPITPDPNTVHPRPSSKLACAGDSSGALEYAAEHLAPAAAADDSGGLLEALESAVSLVAFDDPRSSPLADLAGDAERRSVADALNAHMLRSEGRGGADSVMQKLLRQVAYAEDKVRGLRGLSGLRVAAMRVCAPRCAAHSRAREC